MNIKHRKKNWKKKNLKRNLMNLMKRMKSRLKNWKKKNLKMSLKIHLKKRKKMSWMNQKNLKKKLDNR